MIYNCTITFVIISVEERIPELGVLLKSIKERPQFDEYDINIMYQGDRAKIESIQNLDRVTKIFHSDEKLGCHNARLMLLEKIKYDVYINLDDDMELLDVTNYSPCIDKVMIDKSAGFIITNWGRTMKLALEKIPKMRNAFTKQIMCYNGGGMVYNNTIADLMRGLPKAKATFDNAWPLTAYINGYTNYRFMGSIAVHRVCTTGGMNEFMKANIPVLMMHEYIDFKRAKRQTGTGMDYLIPLDKDVNQKAHYLHRFNKK